MEYVKVFLSMLDKIKTNGKDEKGNQLLYFGEMNIKSILAQVLITNMNDDYIFIDDGTSQLMVPHCNSNFIFKVGQYLQVAMILIIDDRDGSFYPEIEMVLDLSLSPDRESLWNYEVVAFYHKYYKPLIFQNGFTFKKIKKLKEKEIDDNQNKNNKNNINSDGDKVINQCDSLMVDDLSLNQEDIDYDLLVEEESMYMSNIQYDNDDYSLYEDKKVDNQDEEDGEEVEFFFENDTEDDEDNIDQLLSFSNKKQRTKDKNSEEVNEEITENNNTSTIDEEQTTIDDLEWDE